MTRQEELRKMVAEATAEEPNWAASLRKAKAMNEIGDMAPTLATDLADALDQIERLKVALQPFADAAEEADEYGFDDENQAAVDCGMCREARAYLTTETPA